MMTFRPFGLSFARSFGGTHGNELRTYPAPNGGACPNLHKGAPVRLAAGVVTSVGADPSGAWLGVVNGAAWVDPITSQPQMRNFLPADVSSAGFIDGDNRPQVYVTDNPTAIFSIQANASVTAGDLGLNFNVTTLGEDDLYGQSRYALAASTRTTANTAPLKVVGLARLPGNDWGNPFPVVEVKINQQIHTVLSAAL
jgi:hypothetical protein